MHHQEQDALSLALHTEAVGMMRADPALIDRAIAILIRWDKTCDHHSKPLRDEWMRILTDRLWDIALDPGERGNQLRQASPVSCILPNARRLEIIKECKQLAKSD